MKVYEDDVRELALTKDYFMSLVPPENNYERVLWLNKLQKEFSRMALLCSSESTAVMEHIKSTKEESPDYEIVQKWCDKNESEVDWDLLEEELPEVYEKSLSFPATAAAALVGLDKITEFCISEVGDDRVRAASNPTIGNLKKALSKNEQPRYIKIVRRQNGEEIVMKAKNVPRIE